VLFLTFLIPAISAPRNPLSESVFLLQSYYLDHIGGVENRFHYKKVGTDYDSFDINNSLFHTLPDHPVRASNPFWLQFVDNNYHYVLPKRLVFNFSSFVRFRPASLFIPSISIFVCRCCEFEIVNCHATQKLEVFEVSASSRDVLLGLVEPRTLWPGESLAVTVYLCPSRAALFSAFVLIRTSRGTIPYSITCRVVSTAKDPVVRTLLYFSMNFNVNLTMRIPPALSTHRLAILYDTQLFDEGKSIINYADRYTLFVPIFAKPGNYVTFIHMLNPTSSRSFPLYLSVSQKLLQPIYPIIYLEMVTSPSGSSGANVILVNPTELSYSILSVSLPRDLPPNLHIEPSTTTVCAPFGDITVARVVLGGGRLGEVDTHVDVVYNASYEGSARGKVEQSLEIPVRGWVDYGEFEPSEPAIRIVQIDGEIRTISFTNRFQVPVVVVAARIEDPSFRVVGFVPFIVPAGDRSKEIRFKLTRRSIATYFETVLIVDTNATIRRVPIYCYTGQVTISKRRESDPSSHLFFHFGKTLCNSGVNVSIWVHNPNPADYLLTDFNVSAGLQVFAFWAADEASGLRNHRLPQFSTERLDVQIVFKPVAGSSVQNDSISFGAMGSISHIVVSWIPYTGSFAVSTSLARPAVLGNWYNATVFINSSYGVGRRVFGAVSHQDWLGVRPLPAYMRPGILTGVATVNFVFLPEHVNGLVLGDIHNSTHQVQVWSEFWRRPHSLTMGFFLQLKGNSSMRVTFKVTLACSVYENVILDVGFVLPGVNYTRVFQITNKHDCTVAFYSPSFNTVALPRQLLSIPLILNAESIGYFSHDLPVTTNVTPPFFVNISGFAVPPMVRFVGDDRAEITELVFRAASGGEWPSSGMSASVKWGWERSPARRARFRSPATDRIVWSSGRRARSSFLSMSVWWIARRRSSSSFSRHPDR
jgi:hypothetical protein